MTKLKIKVTKDILERSKMCVNGDPKNPVGSHCAIALAVRDIFPKAHVTAYAIDVKGITPYLEPIDDLSIGLPHEAKEFISLFDALSPAERLKMPEIEFEVEIPDEIINEINIEEIRPLLENHPTLQLV